MQSSLPTRLVASLAAVFLAASGCAHGLEPGDSGGGHGGQGGAAGQGGSGLNVTIGSGTLTGASGSTSGGNATSGNATGGSTTSSSSGGGACDGQGDCNTCQDCTINGMCAPEFDACVNSFDCLDYTDCASLCTSTDMACFDACGAAYPTGEQLFSETRPAA